MKDIFPTFASRSGGEGNKLKRWHSDKEGRIYFKLILAKEKKIATFAARFGRTES
ncbi:hypothetical protein OQX63_19895 [Pedobacter sp. PF22-3]|uniref:hypothetical protein n=1 Tax=Pedobacter sp. PF22-3 TaxID=2994467 RepID=UPI00224807D5|nr:hypothetical protein [Pedobacter sp. PF22-3]MCX2495766.1 hypothetical protein [Pedobacter sp. PF22-3]